MSQRSTTSRALLAFGAALVAVACQNLRGEDLPDTQEQLRQLRKQNEDLQEQLRRQAALIESLTAKVNAVQDASAKREEEMEGLRNELKEPSPPPASSSSSWSLGKLSIGGEGSVGFFKTGSQGQFPNSSFRIDEARLFLEAPVIQTVYFYSEIDLATRESSDLKLTVGELYVDFENVSRFWNCDRLVNIRLGHFYTPFGEEYLSRYAIDNPLISRSLPDLWAVDEGIEFYGKAGNFGYALAVQNGGIDDTKDFNNDKAVAGRICYDPTRWLHLSVSGMRTGNLEAKDDFLSAMWFGSGFFRSLGGSRTTQFQANLAEGDVEVRLPHGHLKAFGGWVGYSDNDPTANNRRDVYYYSLEATHDLVGKLYGALRFSQILAGDGFPIVGNGDFGKYFFGSLTQNLWRLSLGLGYRWSRNLVLKAEYSFERGHELGGQARDHEDLVAAEAAFRF